MEIPPGRADLSAARGDAVRPAHRHRPGCRPDDGGLAESLPARSRRGRGAAAGRRARAAPPDQREQLLARYRDAKEDHFTEGLAHAIPHVTAKFQEKVRAALVERLARLPADELRAHLDDDGELRLAAARAFVRTADAGMIPDLIGLLTDADSKVGEAAHQALRRLTGEDFGPPASASEQQRDAAAAKWDAWHRQQSK